MNQKEFFKILDREGFERLRIRLKIDKGELINIVVQYESLIEKKWTAIVRYDIEHGFFHRDMMTPQGDKIKTPIDISDLKSAIIYAEQDIKDKWEHYKQRFLKGFKK
jgi:DNA-directed RNA polymerase subunit L